MTERQFRDLSFGDKVTLNKQKGIVLTEPGNTRVTAIIGIEQNPYKVMSIAEELEPGWPK